MILADTSALINYLRGRKTAGAEHLSKLIVEEKSFGINEFIYQELLQGAKDENEFITLKKYLGALPFYSLRLGIQSFENAARLNFRCRRNGVTVRSTIDLLVAETAIENDLSLLHDDDDFVHIARVIPELKLANTQGQKISLNKFLKNS